MTPDKQKIDALATELFELMCRRASEAEAFASTIQALCMFAAYHSSSFPDLQHKLSSAFRFAETYIDLHRETYEATMKDRNDA